MTYSTSTLEGAIDRIFVVICTKSGLQGQIDCGQSTALLVKNQWTQAIALMLRVLFRICPSVILR